MPTFTVDISDEDLAKLVNTARLTTCEEDAEDQNESFNPCDYSGGNFDDAYYLGETAGDIQGARMMLGLLGVSFA